MANPKGNKPSVSNGTKPSKPTVSNGTKPSMIAPDDCKVPQPGDDGISSLVWSPTSNLLVSTNWDSCVRCWDVNVKEPQGIGQIQANPQALVSHANQKPVLDCCFSADGKSIFSAGCDNAVRIWTLGEQYPNNVAREIGTHDAPVKSVRYLPNTNLVVSGGWDKKLKFWDLRDQNPVKVFELDERVYGLDVKNDLMVVITADKKIAIYNVKKGKFVKRLMSKLDQTRCVSCFPNQKGFAVGSIDGRVAFHGIDGYEVHEKKPLIFKCHRQESQNEKKDVFAVNDIAYNNRFGTFATVGSDCCVNFWDIDNEKLLKPFAPLQRPITCAAFNTQGKQNLFAYASSYDWSKGSEFHAPGNPNEIFIHYCHDDEIKPRKKKN